MFDRSPSTIRSVISRLKSRNSLENLPRSGRPKSLTNREERKILEENRKNPHLSAPKINTVISTSLGTNVSTETVRRVLRSQDLHGRCPRKKPLLSSINISKRLSFAQTYLDRNLEYWEQVIFSDESKFNIFGSDGEGKVWRKPCEELKLKNVKPTVKHGGGSVLVWGCMSARGVGKLVFIDGIMNAEGYLKILKENLHSSATKMGLERDKFIFQQDNDPKHTAWKVKSWLLYNTKQIHTPPQSPEVNPIENLWAHLKLKVQEHKISSKNELKEILLKEWSNIPEVRCRKLVESMPRRLQAIKENNGLHTKY